MLLRFPAWIMCILLCSFVITPVCGAENEIEITFDISANKLTEADLNNIDAKLHISENPNTHMSGVYTPNRGRKTLLVFSVERQEILNIPRELVLVVDRNYDSPWEGVWKGAVSTKDLADFTKPIPLTLQKISVIEQEFQLIDDVLGKPLAGYPVSLMPITPQEEAPDEDPVKILEPEIVAEEPAGDKTLPNMGVVDLSGKKPDRATIRLMDPSTNRPIESAIRAITDADGKCKFRFYGDRQYSVYPSQRDQKTELDSSYENRLMLPLKTPTLLAKIKVKFLPLLLHATIVFRQDGKLVPWNAVAGEKLKYATLMVCRRGEEINGGGFSRFIGQGNFYEFKLPDGQYTLLPYYGSDELRPYKIVEGANFTIDRRNKSPVEHQVVLEIRQQFKLSLRFLHKETQRPIVNLNVTLTPVGEARQNFVTDKEGRIVLPTAWENKYKVAVPAGNSDGLTAEFQLDREIEQDFFLIPRRTVRMTVINADKTPIVGATLMFEENVPPLKQKNPIHVRAGADGVCQIEGVTEGNYIVHIARPDEAALIQILEIVADVNQTVVLPPSIPVVVGVTGLPIQPEANAAILVAILSHAEPHTRISVTYFRRDQNIKLAVLPGKYDLFLQPQPGYYGYTAATFECKEGQKEIVLNIAVPQDAIMPIERPPIEMKP